MIKKNKKIITLFMFLCLMFILKSTILVDASSNNKFQTKKIKDKEIRINNQKLNSIDLNSSGLIIDGKEIKKVALKNKDKVRSVNNYRLDLTNEEESVIKQYNKETNDILIPLSVEETTIKEEQENNNILLEIVNGVFLTKNINAKTSVTKTNYWGVGYEVYKSGSTLLYCVQYGPYAGKSYNKYSDFEKFLKNYMKWSNDKIKKAQKIALWATYYTKKASPDDYKYYASGQSLIWKQWHPGATDNRKMNINNRVNSHSKKVSFNTSSVVKTIKAGDTLEIKDSNGELSSWFTIKNAADFKAQTGISVSKSGNVLKFINPKNNTKTTTGTLKLEKYKNIFDTGAGYGLYASGLQSLANMTYNENIEASMLIKGEALEYGKIKIIKDMDDEDLYGQIIRNSNNDVIYTTKDGRKVVTDGSVIIDVLKYPKKQDMIDKNLFNNKIEYEYPLLEIKQELRYKTDNEGNKIPIADSNGLNPSDVNWTETYEQELYDLKDENGNTIHTAKLDENGKLIFAKAVIDNLTYPTQREMDNIYRGKGVTFNVIDKRTNKVIETVTTNENGEAISNNVLIGEYSVKEIKTLADFVVLNKTYDVTVKKGETTVVNKGNALVNMKKMANLELIKIDEMTKKPLKNVLFGVYEASNDNLCKAEDIVDENLVWTGISDSEGKIEWITSKERAICLVELESKAGYLKNDIIHTVQMEHNKVNVVEQTNNAINLKIKINKLDENNLKLQGVEFTMNVYGKTNIDSTIANNGNEAVNSDAYDILIHKNENLVTDDSGVITLDYNSMKKFFDEEGNSYKFELIETKKLEGYQDSLPITFFVTLDENNKIVMSENEASFNKNITNIDVEQVLDIVVINEKEKATIVLSKIAADTKEKQIATYNFQFYDEKGNIYRSEDLKSTLNMPQQLDFDPHITSKICAKEVKAPNNFILDKSIKCQITKNTKPNQVVNFDFENERKVLAKTGGIDWKIIFEKVLIFK